MDGVSVTIDPLLPPHVAYLVSTPYEDWRREQPPRADVSWQAWAAACVVRLETSSARLEFLSKPEE